MLVVPMTLGCMQTTNYSVSKAGLIMGNRWSRPGPGATVYESCEFGVQNLPRWPWLAAPLLVVVWRGGAVYAADFTASIT